MSATVTPDWRHVREAIAYLRRNKIETYYPETGPLRRELYVKHMAFFAAGAKYTERAAIAANRIGKSEGISAYEVTLHLTGLYPDWWIGRRFKKAINCWVSGTTNNKTREILQAKLLGNIVRDANDEPGAKIGLGTGMIPGDAILATRPKPGIPNAIDVAYIRHVSGGTSTVTFKSYEMTRKGFEGSEVDVIALDEEPPQDVYDECIIRTMATGGFQGGIIIATFTPLDGWTDVVELYLDAEKEAKAERFHIQAGWDDAPHLSDEEKRKLLAKIHPNQRDARSKGIPTLGAGAIYPVAESEFVIDPLNYPIPHHWPRAYGMDVGLKTAVVYGTLDRDSDVLTLYAEYYREEADPSVHAPQIKTRGGAEWIPGVIDPWANHRSSTDGQRLITMYRKLGLDVVDATNAVHAGIDEVWMRLTSGRLKICRNLTKLLEEMRIYRRDTKGRIVKQRDHLCDSMRYLVMACPSRFIVEPAPPKNDDEEEFTETGSRYGSSGWMR